MDRLRRGVFLTGLGGLLLLADLLVVGAAWLLASPFFVSRPPA